MYKKFSILFLMATGVIAWGQTCPAVFPTSLQLTLPRTLPPGSYPYVKDTAALWIFCDAAPPQGAMAHISVPDSTVLTLNRALTKTSSLDTLVYGKSDLFNTGGPAVFVTAMSTAMHPPAGTQQYSLQIAVDGQAGPVTVPVSVTFTDALFVHTSQPSLTFDLYVSNPTLGNPREDLGVWFPNSQIPHSFTATSENWLSVTPASGIGWTDAMFEVQSAGLEPGNYLGFATITAPDAVNSPLKIPANLTYYAPQPSVTPISLVFSQAAGDQAPAAKQLVVSTPGGSDSFTASTDAAWLFVDPARSTFPGTVNVSVKGDGLTPSTYTGHVAIQADYAFAVTVPVTFVYGSSSALHVSPDSITLYHWSDMSTVDFVDRGSFNVTADRSMYWTATKSPESWFNLYSNGGFTPSPLTFTVPSWPAPGTYSGTITVSSMDASNGPQTVKVKAMVLEAAPLTLSPTTLNFRAFGADPAPQTVAVSAPSPTPFSVNTTTSVGGNWLTASQSSGQTPATVTVSIKTTGLQCCSYNGRVIFSIPQGGNPAIVMQMLIYLDYFPPTS